MVSVKNKMVKSTHNLDSLLGTKIYFYQKDVTTIIILLWYLTARNCFPPILNKMTFEKVQSSKITKGRQFHITRSPTQLSNFPEIFTFRHAKKLVPLAILLLHLRNESSLYMIVQRQTILTKIIQNKSKLLARRRIPMFCFWRPFQRKILALT